MLYKGSCHCLKVQFSFESKEAMPYMYCYCSICRKTQGGGGYSINLSGKYETLKFTGKEFIKIYQSKTAEDFPKDATESPSQRHFCQECGSSLWIYDNRWPDIFHPFASAIDSDLPLPPFKNHIMVKDKSNWIEIQKNDKDEYFDSYPRLSIKEWHANLS